MPSVSVMVTVCGRASPAVPAMAVKVGDAFLVNPPGSRPAMLTTGVPGGTVSMMIVCVDTAESLKPSFCFAVTV